MVNAKEFASDLSLLGVTQSFGVLGSGDSLAITKELLSQGGTFHQTASEFSAPIISSSINRLSLKPFRAISLSIRGPGLSSSFPGLHYNFLEDNHSLSISEGLSNEQHKSNLHKTFNSQDALYSLGLSLREDIDQFDLKTKLETLLADPNTRMIHVETGSNRVYSYSKSSVEMCSDKLHDNDELKKRIVLVVGKRGMENSSVKKLLHGNSFYFLTPAALPFADISSPNFLGVWTGNEQFKSFLTQSGLLSGTLILRIGVMKRELLSLKKTVPHLDFDVSFEDSDEQLSDLAELIEKQSRNQIDREILRLTENKAKIALSETSWSVYSVVQTINEIFFEINICFDVGSFATILETYLRPRRKMSLHSSFVGKFMGTSVPTSIGVSFAEPAVPVLCLLGEAGFASSISEIVSIANLQLPICLILLSDGTMHSVTGRVNFEERFKESFLPPNLETIMQLRVPGLPTYVIKSRSQLSKSLEEWNRKTPLLLILKFDASHYARNVEMLR